LKKLITLLLILLIFIVGCKKENHIIKTYYLDEAFSIIPIVSIIDEEEKLTKLDIKKQLSNITNELDNKFNVFKKDSMISQVNNNSGIKETTVDDEFIYVLSKAIEVSEQTQTNNKSLYDVSIYSVWKEWNFENNYFQYGNYSTPPTIEVINQKLPLVNYENIIIDNVKNTIYLNQKGMMIDLGSIVKGYAADKISEYLKSININNCLIDVGGNIVTMGKNIGTSKEWKTGVLMPYTYNTEIGYIIANDKKESFVTSGIYERYIVEKNIKTNEEIMYHHILNPNTGYPENNDLLSVTIICENSILADAYSTAVFLMGSKQGIEFINNNDQLEAIFITKDKEVKVSENLNERFVINNDIYNQGYSFYK